MKILTVSDVVDRKLYNTACRERYSGIDLVLACGDLPFYYLDFLLSCLNVPVYFVFGNHHTRPMVTTNGELVHEPGGAINLDMRVLSYKGLLIGGLEGCMLYNYGPKQYTERQMRRKIRRMWFKLWLNKWSRGRYLDIMMTHAPPAGIHDEPDRCHQGFQCFRRFIERYRPTYFIHGHTHRYGRQKPWKTEYCGTTIINTVGHKIIELDPPPEKQKGKKGKR